MIPTTVILLGMIVVTAMHVLLPSLSRQSISPLVPVPPTYLVRNAVKLLLCLSHESFRQIHRNAGAVRIHYTILTALNILHSINLNSVRKDIARRRSSIYNPLLSDRISRLTLRLGRLPFPPLRNLLVFSELNHDPPPHANPNIPSICNQLRLSSDRGKVPGRVIQEAPHTSSRPNIGVIRPICRSRFRIHNSVRTTNKQRIFGGASTRNKP